MSGRVLNYMTAILDGSALTAAFFSGTTPPTAGIGFKQYTSLSGKNDNGYCIGGSTDATACMTGKIHSYRYYKRVLTHEELMWNRVVDEARFFGRRAPIPATNVVVTANDPRVGGFQPNGHYYVDSGDFTITAPASTNFDGRAYACTGYTLETWDDATGAWSAPVSYESRSYTFADPSTKVRLTWQWTAGDGLVAYGIDDYVWDGLIWFYDGIRNVGRDQPHDYASLNWKNLRLDMNFKYSLGNDVYNYQRSILEGGNTTYNQTTAMQNRWTYEGQQTDVPKVCYMDSEDWRNNERMSDRWIDDGSYLKLKNVRLTYTFPVKSSWLMGLRIWGEANNVFTVTKFHGVDPEMSSRNSTLFQGIDTGLLSVGRNFNLGVTINL